MKSESEVIQSCPTLRDPMDCSPPGSSVDGIFPSKSTGVGCYRLLRRVSIQGDIFFPSDLTGGRTECKMGWLITRTYTPTHTPSQGCRRVGSQTPPPRASTSASPGSPPTLSKVPTRGQLGPGCAHLPDELTVSGVGWVGVEAGRPRTHRPHPACPTALWGKT